MGIPGFNVWFSSQNKGACYEQLANVPVDHLYIDLNSLLHNALRNARSWELFHRALHGRLNSVLAAVRPRKSVMLAVDGPGPLAKLLTQRERRKKGANKASKSSKHSKKAKHDKGGDSSEPDVLTGNAITPGTRMMADITLSLAFWVYTKLRSREYGHLKIELSDGTVQGEGEVKILGRLAHHWAEQGPDDTHLIVGDDADLVLMACVSWKDHLYVANTAMNEDNQITSAMQVFSVDRLHTSWLAHLLHPSHVSLPENDRTKLLCMKLDLTMLAILASGNDYLPGLKGIKLDTAWSKYTKLRRSASGVGKSVCSINPATGAPLINLANLAELLRGLVNYQASTTQPSVSGEDSGEGGGDEVGSFEGNTTKAPASPDKYLHGLIWVLHKYVMGECPDYRFVYDGIGPQTSRLIDHCEERARAGGSRAVLSHAEYEPLPADCTSPLLPFACAMALLPASCDYLLPEPVRPLMKMEGSPVADIYEECQDCFTLNKEVNMAAMAVASARATAESLTARLRAAKDEGDEELAESLRQELSQAHAQVEARRKEGHLARQARLAHQKAYHPYIPFPVERLAAAAATVDIKAFAPEERCLTSFGQPVVMSRVSQEQWNSPPGSIMTSPPSPFAGHEERGGFRIQCQLVVTTSTAAAVQAQARALLGSPSSVTSTTPGIPALSSGPLQQQQRGMATAAASGGSSNGLGGHIQAQLVPDTTWAAYLARRYISAPTSHRASQTSEVRASTGGRGGSGRGGRSSFPGGGRGGAPGRGGPGRGADVSSFSGQGPVSPRQTNPWKRAEAVAEVGAAGSAPDSGAAAAVNAAAAAAAQAAQSLQSAGYSAGGGQGRGQGQGRGRGRGRGAGADGEFGGGRGGSSRRGFRAEPWQQSSQSGVPGQPPPPSAATQAPGQQSQQASYQTPQFGIQQQQPQGPQAQALTWQQQEAFGQPQHTFSGYAGGHKPRGGQGGRKHAGGGRGGGGRYSGAGSGGEYQQTGWDQMAGPSADVPATQQQPYASQSGAGAGAQQYYRGSGSVMPGGYAPTAVAPPPPPPLPSANLIRASGANSPPRAPPVYFSPTQQGSRLGQQQQPPRQHIRF